MFSGTLASLLQQETMAPMHPIEGADRQQRWPTGLQFLERPHNLHQHASATLNTRSGCQNPPACAPASAIRLPSSAYTRKSSSANTPAACKLSPDRPLALRAPPTTLS